MSRRALKFDIPGREFRVGPNAVLGQGWEGVFGPDVSTPLELVVDVGFGRGEFIMELARAHPDVAFVGIEQMWKRVLKMARRLARTEIGNVRLVEGGAESAVEELFEEGSVRTFWINFPDPWPKARHAGRRLVQSDFVHEVARRLVPGGDLMLATDDAPYAEQVQEVLAGEPLLENLYAPEPWVAEVPGRPPTVFELEWRSRGRPLHYFAYRRIRP